MLFHLKNLIFYKQLILQSEAGSFTNNGYYIVRYSFYFFFFKIVCNVSSTVVSNFLKITSHILSVQDFFLTTVFPLSLSDCSWCNVLVPNRYDTLFTCSTGNAYIIKQYGVCTSDCFLLAFVLTIHLAWKTYLWFMCCQLLFTDSTWLTTQLCQIHSLRSSDRVHPRPIAVLQRCTCI